MLDSQFLQVKKYVIDKEINVKTKLNEYIKSWILGLRKMSKNTEEIQRNDIRSFMI